MVKTLTKHGNSYALIIDKPILEMLHISPDTPLEITTNGNALMVSPVREPLEEKKFEDAIEMVHKRFGRAMKKLAE